MHILWQGFVDPEAHRAYRGAAGRDDPEAGGTPEQRRLESRSAYELAEGDVVNFRCSGRGGFGPPPELLRGLMVPDVAKGFVSPAAARDVYGLAEREEG